MITLMSLASMQTPNYEIMNSLPAKKPSLVSYAKPTESNGKTPLIAYQAYTMTHKPSFRGYKQEFKLPEDNKTQFKSFDEVFIKYEPSMKNVLTDFNQRKDKDGQFLKWVSLPNAQLSKNENGKSHLDEIYEQANQLIQRKNPDGTQRPLVVLGIGGSKHTAEFLLNMNGEGNKGKVYFYSDIDPVSFNNFIKETGKNIKDLNFLVASK